MPPNDYSSSFILAQAKLLHENVDGATVIENLRQHYNTSCSVEKMASSVRTQYLRLRRDERAHERPPQLARALRTLRAEAEKTEDAACVRRVEQLDQMTPKQMYDTVRFHKKAPFCEGADAVNAALRDVRVMPANVEAFRLSTNEAAECREEQKLALIEKNVSTVTVEAPSALLRQMVAHLEAPDAVSTIQLVIALLFVSGRRSTELLNQRSTFRAIPERPFHCIFVGQLKKHTAEECKDAFMIPLLCRCDVFLAALTAFRATPKQRAILEGAYSNKQVAKVYTSQLHYGQKRHLPMLNKMHDLRSLYARYVEACFEHTLAVPLLCKLVLGHDDMSESLHYVSLRVEGVEDRFGPLWHEEFPQFREIREGLSRRRARSPRGRRAGA